MLLDDFLIRRTALLFSVIGIISVFVICQISEPKEIKISEIGSKHISSKVSTKGIVSWSRISKGVLIFQLQDNAKISCVIFSPTIEQLSTVRKGHVLNVEGKVQLYKNSFEIIAEKVSLLESG